MKTLSAEVLGTKPSRQNRETEVEFYCKVGNPIGLSQATHVEQHHQLECRFETGATSRVRHTKTADGEKYVFTMKVKTEGEQGLIERNKEVDKAFFDDFRLVAKRELVKTRYIFDSKDVTLTIVVNGEKQEITIPNIQYEVDVYKQLDGKDTEYCKIDVEIDNIVNFIDTNHPEIKSFDLRIKLSHLPFEPREPFRGGDESKKDKYDLIWKDFARILR